MGNIELEKKEKNYIQQFLNDGFWLGMAQRETVTGKGLDEWSD